MRRVWMAAAFLAAAFLPHLAPGRCALAGEGDAGREAARKVASTEADRSSVEITVYNVGLGLVKEHRHVVLGQGESTLLFMDVASQVIPSSVSVRSVKEGDAVSVLEQ